MKPDRYGVSGKGSKQWFNVATGHGRRPRLKLSWADPLIILRSRNIEGVRRKRIPNSLGSAGREIQSVSAAHHGLICKPEGRPHARCKVILIGSNQSATDSQSRLCRRYYGQGSRYNRI